MSSGMRLRSVIRAPIRYGDFVEGIGGESEDETASLLQSMRSAREQGRTEDEPAQVEAYEPAQDNNNKKVRQRREPVRPKIVDYDPNLPPAPFPTLSEPRPRGEIVPGHNIQPVQLNNANTNVGSQHASIQDIIDSGQHFENYLASNNDQNVTYTTNMQIMAHAGDGDLHSDSGYDPSDSDGEYGPSVLKRVRKLLAETPSDPSWNDVAPSLQVEIITNLCEDEVENWARACHRLGLTNEENQTLASLIGRRNKAIERENELLKEMRDKQLKALTNIDHSIIKQNNVPPQLVLHRLAKDQDICISIAQCTSRELKKIKTTNLLHAKTSDVLTARQYLARHGLSRDLAGKWGNGLVTMIEAHEEAIEPESWEWKEDLTTSNKRGHIDSVHSPATATPGTEVQWQWISGFTEKTIVSANNLLRDPTMFDPVRDFEGKVPWWHRRENIPVPILSDRQASLQWKLKKARQELETKRALQKAAQHQQGAQTHAPATVQTQAQTTAQVRGPHNAYGLNDTGLLRNIKIGGEMVPTGVNMNDPDLDLFKGAL